MEGDLQCSKLLEMVCFSSLCGLHSTKGTKTLGDSKSVARKGVLVRLRPGAPTICNNQSSGVFAKRNLAPLIHLAMREGGD
jgi:hypothetical protein